MRLAAILVTTLVVAGCGPSAVPSSAASAAAIVTAAPAVTATPAPTPAPTPRPTPPPTPRPTPSPTPVPTNYKFVPAANSKGSGLRVAGEASLTWGAWSAEDETTARLIIPVQNASARTLETQRSTDASTKETHVLLHFSDGRKPRLIAAGVIANQMTPGSGDWLTAGWRTTDKEMAAVRSVDVMVLARKPKFEREIWNLVTTKFATDGDRVDVAGTATNAAATPDFRPLPMVVLLDRDKRPLTYLVGFNFATEPVPVGDSFDWVISEDLPPGVLAAADSAIGVQSTSLDEWSSIGAMYRNLAKMSYGY